MFALGVRFSRVSVSAALLILGAAPTRADAASCDSTTCLTTPQANVRVDDGSWFAVGTGGVLSASAVSLGTIRLLDEGKATQITVSNSGRLEVLENGQIDNTLVEDGVMVVAGAATALTTHVLNGDLEVAQQAVISDTGIDGGRLYVYGDGLAKNTRVSNSQVTVYQSGTMQRTLINAGGEVSLADSATAMDTEVNSGAVLSSMAGTSVFNTTVNSAGLMVLGAGAAASDSTINAGGRLQLKGDATLHGANRVDGQVEFADPAVTGAFHTLNIDGALSGNGHFLMSTDLAALRGDLLKVQGPISDVHTLVVADSGNVPSGTQQSLLLVDGNGGSGDFQLYGNTVDAGAYRYSLQKQGDDWYLGKPPENIPDVDIEDPQTPGSPDPVVIQPPTTPPVSPPQNQADTLSKGANAAVAGHAASAALLDAQKHSTQQHLADLRSGRDQGGVWLRGYGAEQHIDSGSSRAFEQQVNGMEIGADQAFALAHGTLYVGGLFGQGQGRQDFGERSKGNIDSTTLGAYASYQAHEGIYVDGALKYSRLDNEIRITGNLGDPVKAHYDSHAVTAETQIGKAIELGRGWFVEPQAGLQVARISGGHYTASNGLSVNQGTMTSLQSRVGGQFGRELQLDKGLRIKPYVKATWVTEHAGDSSVHVNGATLDSRLPGSRGELGGGVMLTVAQNQQMYVEGQYVKGRDIEQPWAVSVGYRYNW
ncbi:autotransporter outer membrane beta-barrel domain-containing protein [Pseudomonas atagonensis]|uniref:autotransporter outer membrane beta-barrel domain-containing protein n=1 Tax=Pseudomonas atagonensis TaxID=2609964 RepID=UPI00140E05A8|nr:autotransporter outer membrane beta-barrel domain-containing protein [Pseudomonas atagonensis]